MSLCGIDYPLAPRESKFWAGVFAGRHEPYDCLIITSDLHNHFNGISPYLVQLIEIARKENGRLIMVGDGENMIPYGKDKYLLGTYRHKLADALDGYRMDMLEGNHNPLKWIQQLFFMWPNIHCSRQLEFYWWPMDCYIHLRHGHEWFIDWFILRNMAPGFTRIATRFFPTQWYWLCKQMGWIPSELKDTGDAKLERKYHVVVQHIWVNAAKYALSKKKDVLVITGHTHALGAQLFILNADKMGYIHADPATLAIGSYIKITDHLEFCRLEG